MFNRYWRIYPWWMQAFLLFMMMFTLMSFSFYLVLMLVPKATGLAYADLFNLTARSAPRAIRASLVAQAGISIGTFVLPSLLFAAITHPRIREYLGLRLPGKPLHWLLTAGIVLGYMPVAIWGEGWMMRHMHFGQWAAETQQKNDDMFNAFLRLSSGPDLCLLLTVLAILPALGEELFFRGAILRLFHRGFNRRKSPELNIAGETFRPDFQQTMLRPVVGSALLFALWHTNPYGFVFIFIAGCLLALIYALTRSLLCSMLGHMLYNGSQVILSFIGHHDAAVRKVTEESNLPAIYPLLGLAVFVLCFYLLVKQQTPLSTDWSDDFRAEKEALNLPQP